MMPTARTLPTQGLTISGLTSWRAPLWLRRYLPLELAGTATLLLAAAGIYRQTGSLAAAALAGTVGESAGFYGCALVRSWSRWRRSLVLAGHPRPRAAAVAAGMALRGLLVEFGPAEVASLVLSPVLLYLLPVALDDPVSGWLAGKLVADVIFYTVAAVGLRRVRNLVMPAGAES